MSELRVALTFDAEHPSRAGQSTDAPHRILDVLHRTGVRGTFFLQGRWATAFPATARRIAEDGHLVGNISFGPAFCECVAEVAKVPLDVHLMITRPDTFLQRFAKLAKNVTIPCTPG